MNEAPERIFIDPRVARTMPQEIHETDGISIAYVRQDIAEKAAQTAMDAVMPAEFIVQICNGYDQSEGSGYSSLYALSNIGRIFTQGYDPEKKEMIWELLPAPISLDQSSE